MRRSSRSQHLHALGAQPAASAAGAGPDASAASPRQARQSAQLAGLAKSTPIQRKARIELDKIDDPEQKERVRLAIEAARKTRRDEKQQARLAWLPRDADTRDYGDKDTLYNTAMAAARQKYGLTISALKDSEKLGNAQYKSGSDYYGENIGGGVFKRPEGKEYVQDAKGVFIPRYVRRELSAADIDVVRDGGDLEPTGASTHGSKAGIWDVGSKKRKGEDLSSDDREFLQQSMGGGHNQFAFSHTASKHPILSNKHFSFGKPEPGKEEEEHGRSITDMSLIGQQERRAQWTLAPEAEGGHKISRPISDFTMDWVTDARKRKVVSSGYRNMEVVTGSVPKDAIVAQQGDWEAGDYDLGVSNAGQWFDKVRKKKEGRQ